MSEEKVALELPGKKKGINRIKSLTAFAKAVMQISRKVGFRISARGWCYQLEGFGLITKAQFDRVESVINDCREYGLLPIDFTAEEEGRKFSGVETPTSGSPIKYMKRYLDAALDCENWYTPDWWDGEEYYIQMLVEKIDLKTLFGPVCQQYHIAIATSKGWSSMLQRAEYARRFKQAESKGLKCVLLYCGDHDPDGLRISEFIHNNLRQLRLIRWEDGAKGYDPANLTIDRFGLNYDFIEANHLSWIDNLYTGSGRNLADPSHPNYSMPYVQEYLAKIGQRKCEANALVVRPEGARDLCTQAIVKYVGDGALGRFKAKRDKIVAQVHDFRTKTGLDEAIKAALAIIQTEEA